MTTEETSHEARLRNELNDYREALTEVWRSAMEHLATCTELPIKDLDNAFPSRFPDEVADTIGLALQTVELRLRNLEARPDVLKALRASLEEKNAETSALLDALNALETGIAKKDEEILRLRNEHGLAVARATSVTDYKSKLRSLPAEQELKDLLIYVQQLANITAPGSDRGGVTMEEIVRRVQQRYEEHRTLEAALRRRLGISEFSPILDNLDARFTAHDETSRLLDFVCQEIGGIDVTSYALDPRGTLRVAIRKLKARTTDAEPA